MFDRLPLLLLALMAASCCTEPMHTNERTQTLSAAEVVDHSVFDQLLKRFVAADGTVDYPALHDDSEARQRLADYIAGFAAVDPDQLAGRNEQMAFWINAYNAITLHAILQYWPTASIRDHDVFWDGVITWCGDREVSLDAIEHEILRPMGDPRIHMAINCASKSCPVLRQEAYVAALLDAQLENQSQRFVNDTSRNVFDRSTQVARLSKIFDWFGEDFDVAPYDGVRGFVRRYVNPKREWLGGDFEIDYLTYDWSLNGPTSR